MSGWVGNWMSSGGDGDSAAAAAASAAAAATAATSANASATAALAAAKTYTTTTAGLAATTSGQVFLVSTASANVYIVYSNTSGTAALIGYLNIANGVYYTNSVPTGYAYAIIDDYGHVAFGIKADGTVQTQTATTNALTTTTLNGSLTQYLAILAPSITNLDAAAYAWSIIDDYKRVALAVLSDGAVQASTINTALANITQATVSNLTATTINNTPVSSLIQNGAGYFESEINHVVEYGQSLSVGYSSLPVISTSASFDSLKFNGGVRPVDGNLRTALLPLIETADSTNTYGETPCSGTSDAIKGLILSENGISYTQQNYQLLFSADGVSNQTIAQLSNPTGAPFVGLKASIQAGFTVAQGLGKTYTMGALTYTQGENDQGVTAQNTFRDALEALRVQTQTYANSVTGRSDILPMICYQISDHIANRYPAIGLAYLDASKIYPNVHLATPMYIFPYQSDLIHLTADSSKKLGLYYGLVYKRVVIDQAAWDSLRPISKFAQGSVAQIKFHVPRGKLVFDTTLVALNTNYGFNLKRADGTDVSITVSITGPDTVKILASENIGTGYKLQYAFYSNVAGNGAGPVSGPRGNLRDTQGDSIAFTVNGASYPMHNWCVLFEEIF